MQNRRRERRCDFICVNGQTGVFRMPEIELFSRQSQYRFSCKFYDGKRRRIARCGVGGGLRRFVRRILRMFVVRHGGVVDHGEQTGKFIMEGNPIICCLGIWSVQLAVIGDMEDRIFCDVGPGLPVRGNGITDRGRQQKNVFIKEAGNLIAL